LSDRSHYAVIVFPAVAAIVSLACALVVAGDGWRRPKPDKAAWAIAFALFAAANGAEVAGASAGWTPLLARLYYLSGATLVVGFLALGQLYLLAPRRTAAVGPGLALLVVALAASLVIGAPVDEARLGADGWDALERGPALKALTIGLNAGGTAVVVGGALLSAWRFRRLGIQRHRMIGCVLIAVGTLVVASGGTLARLGRSEALYVAMAVGVAVIFGGYLEARRPSSAVPAAVGRAEGAVPPVAVAAQANGQGAAGSNGSANGHGGPLPPTVPIAGMPRGAADATIDPAIAFLEGHLLPLNDAALAEAARVWSVEPSAADRFTREEARRVWALRLRLSPAGQGAFDAHGVAARLQLAELYHEVLAPGTATLEAERRAGSDGR
jgi:hypothetical protein